MVILFVVAVTLVGAGALLISGLVALLVTAAAAPVAGLLGAALRFARRLTERSRGDFGNRVAGTNLQPRPGRPLPTPGVAELM